MEMRMRLPYQLSHAKEFFNGLMKGKDRKKAYLYAIYIIVPIALLVAGVTLYGSYNATKKATNAKKRELATMAALKADYLGKKAMLDAVSQRAATQGESPVAAVEEIAKRTGMKEKVASVKPLEEKNSPGYTDKPVEVKLQAVDLNHLVNFLYQAEYGPKLMVVRDLSMKARFEDPDLLDVTMRVSLVTRGM